MEVNSPQADGADSSVESEGLGNNQFLVNKVPPGRALLVGDAAVFNVAGGFCAIEAKCPHMQGPLNEGKLNGSTVTCPWHGSEFDVCTGAVLRGPAKEPVKTYSVIVEGEIGRVEKQT
jgi:nitrite reductase/ring-hydroxylating ferredoxin subunit